MNKSEALSILSDIANAAIQLRDECKPNEHLAHARWSSVAREASYIKNDLCATVGEAEEARMLRVFNLFIETGAVRRVAELRGTERVRAAVEAANAKWDAICAKYAAL